MVPIDMKRLLFFLLAACFVAASSAFAFQIDGPAFLSRGGFICYERDAYRQFLQAAADNNGRQANLLEESGKCQVIQQKTKVIYIDNPRRSINWATVQMPSGRIGFTMEELLSSK